MPVTVQQPAYGCAITFTSLIGTGPLQVSLGRKDVSNFALPTGSAAGQVTREYTTTLTLTSAAPTLLDLAALVNEQGETFGFGAIEVLKVTNTSKTAGEDLTVGGGTNGVFAADPTPYKASGRGDSTLFKSTPIVVDPTHHLLQLSVAAGTAVVVTLTLIGR